MAENTKLTYTVKFDANGCIEIKTGERILSCGFSSHDRPDLETKMFDIINDLVQQDLALHTSASKGRCPAVVSVHSANDLVKKMLMPVIEDIATHISKEVFSINWVRALYEFSDSAKSQERLAQEYDAWKLEHDKKMARLTAGIQAIQSLSHDEGFVLTAWGRCNEHKS